MTKTPYDLKTKTDVYEALNAYPPAFYGKGWSYLTTVAQHLAQYDSSSRYAEYRNPTTA